jgi:hypothetical protein
MISNYLNGTMQGLIIIVAVLLQRSDWGNRKKTAEHSPFASMEQGTRPEFAGSPDGRAHPEESIGGGNK